MKSQIDYKLMVRVLRGWRLTIPLEIRIKAKIEEAEPFLASWREDTQQLVFSRLNIQAAGGTVSA